MSELHPSARALIDAAKRGEGPLPSDARARVHRSVLRRAVAVGAAVATTSTASAVSKAAALVATLSSPFAIPGVVSVVAGVAFLVLTAGSTAEPPPRAGPQATTHAIARVARSAPGHIPPADATPALVPPAGATPALVPPAAALEPAPAVLAAPVSAAIPPSKRVAFAASLPTTLAAQGGTVAAAAASAAGPAAGAIEPPATSLADETSSAPVATTLAPAPRTAPAAPDLAGDLDRLRQVHAALRGGRSEAALSLLDREGKRLEAGPLAEEAQGARISALCQLGRVVDARAATTRFVAAWPASPLALRLRGGCEALGANSKPEGD